MIESVLIEGREIHMDDPHIISGMRETRDYYEAPMLRWIAKNIPVGMALDVGANFGNHSIFLAARGWKVIAIEPVKENMQLLLQNTKGLDVTCVWAGASDAPGTARVKKQDDWRWSQVQLRPDGEGDEVYTIPLDIYAPNPINLVKLDAEGMEMAILHGMTSLLKMRHPELFIEAHTDDDLEALKLFLGEYGYILIERFNHSPTYHFSASGRYQVTYTRPVEG